MGYLATIILAAGFSTRMQGLFKPLLPFRFTWPKEHTLTALEQLIQMHFHGGVSHVFVVGGQRENEALATTICTWQKKLRDKQKLSLVTNPDAQCGMFSSVCHGIRAVQQTFARTSQGHVFIHPVDIPLVRICTMQKLLQAQKQHPHAILIPSYGGQSGHPPLIPSEYMPAIVKYDGEQGLQGALNSMPTQLIATADSHILLDMDTQEDYARLQKKALGQHILQAEEALKLLHCLNVPPKGLAHARAVASVAITFAKAFKEQQGEASRINTNLTHVGALLHDMCKQEERHEVAAGKALREMGLGALAPLVEEHTDCQLAEDAPITEKELIYLADKYVYGKSPIPIEERFTQKLHFFAHIPEAGIAIKARLARAKTMEKRLRAEIGKDPFSLAQKALAHAQD